ncbi:MAG: STAS domain-containing protein [Bacilli bacterium]
MLKVLMEFRKGVLFVRLSGVLDKSTITVFESQVKEVVIKLGIKYMVINVEELNNISIEGMKKIKSLKKTVNKSGGKLFICGSDFNDFAEFSKIENELNVFRRVKI